MIEQCYICKRVLRTGIPDPRGWDRLLHGEPVTSALCDACRPLEFARIDREVTALETTDPGDDPGDDPGNW